VNLFEKYVVVPCMIGDPPAAGTAGTPQTFTQEQVNSMVADAKRGLQSENEALKGQLKEASGLNQEFETMVVEAAREQGIDPDDFDEEGNYHGPDLDEGEEEEGEELEAGAEGEEADEGGDGLARGNPPQIARVVRSMRRKHEREMEALRRELDKEKEVRMQADERSKITRLNSTISDILGKLDVVDIEGAKRYFMPQIEFEESEDGGDFVFKTKDGLLVPLDKGLADELPPYLKRPATAGGAGSRGSSMGVGPTGRVAKLDQVKAQVAELETKARKTGNPQDVQAHMSAVKEMQKLEKAATAA